MTTAERSSRSDTQEIEILTSGRVSVDLCPEELNTPTIIAVGTDDPDLAADRILARGVESVIVKRGGDGVNTATANGRRSQIAPYSVEVVCGLGSGEAFGDALCHRLLSGWTLDESARYANAAGAYVAGQLMCADAMPSVPQLRSFINSRSGGEN